MLRNLLICGLIAGVCAGTLAAGLATVTGEPVIDRAIAYEGAHGGPVSRDVQKSAGLLTATVVYGLSVGGLFALAFAVAYGRVARVTPRATAYGLAAAAFVVVFLVPFLKYPANPPGATDPATIGVRTLAYATMVAISLPAAVAALRLRRSRGNLAAAARFPCV